jgi:hypothetical protein
VVDHSPKSDVIGFAIPTVTTPLTNSVLKGSVSWPRVPLDKATWAENEGAARPGVRALCAWVEFPTDPDILVYSQPSPST